MARHHRRAGLAAPLAILTKLEWPRMLFPLVLLLALWMILAAAWPVRAKTPVAEAIPARG
jgi:hypothetical protein